MRLTEAIAWYNNPKDIRHRLSHFQPSDEDYTAKEDYRKKLKEQDTKLKKEKVFLDIFE